MPPLDNDVSGRFSPTQGTCPLEGALRMVGDRWNMRILREAFRGAERFEEFHTKLGVASNVLSGRLRRLVEAGLIERQLYCRTPPRYAYRLTQRGRDFEPVFVSITAWTKLHFGEFAGADRVELEDVHLHPVTQASDAGASLRTGFSHLAGGTDAD